MFFFKCIYIYIVCVLYIYNNWYNYHFELDGIWNSSNIFKV